MHSIGSTSYRENRNDSDTATTTTWILYVEVVFGVEVVVEVEVEVVFGVVVEVEVEVVVEVELKAVRRIDLSLHPNQHRPLQAYRFLIIQKEIKTCRGGVLNLRTHHKADLGFRKAIS